MRCHRRRDGRGQRTHARDLGGHDAELRPGSNAAIFALRGLQAAFADAFGATSPSTTRSRVKVDEGDSARAVIEK